jgi:PAS domain-containing protein
VVYTTGGTTLIVGIGEWSIDLGMSTVETTAFGDTWKQRLPSIREVSGSFSGIADTGASQTFLQNTMLGGSAIALRLYDGTITYWNIATAYLTGVSNSISIDGKGERSFDFDGHGAPTYV